MSSATDIYLDESICFAMLMLQTVLEQIAEQLRKPSFIVRNIIVNDMVVQPASEGKRLVSLDVVLRTGERLTAMCSMKCDEPGELVFNEGVIEIQLIDATDRQWSYRCWVLVGGMIGFSSHLGQEQQSEIAVEAA